MWGYFRAPLSNRLYCDYIPHAGQSFREKKMCEIVLNFNRRVVPSQLRKISLRFWYSSPLEILGDNLEKNFKFFFTFVQSRNNSPPNIQQLGTKNSFLFLSEKKRTALLYNLKVETKKKQSDPALGLPPCFIAFSLSWTRGICVSYTKVI